PAVGAHVGLGRCWAPPPAGGRGGGGGGGGPAVADALADGGGGLDESDGDGDGSGSANAAARTRPAAHVGAAGVAGVCWARSSASAAALTLACAAFTSSSTLVSSMRASTCPGATVSPGRTLTSVTTPAVLKLSPRICTGCTLPAAETVVCTVPRCTRLVVAAAATWAGRPP